MAKPKKLPSGKWHLTLYIGRDDDGKRIYKSITGNTEAECNRKAKSLLKAGQAALTRPKIADLTRVCDAVDNYIHLCSVLSPTTVVGYEKIRRTAFPHLMDVPVENLTRDLVQQAINTEAYREGRRGRISAKTVENEWGLISAALYHQHGLKFDVRLPKKPKHLKEYPEPEAVLQAVIGTSIELPCLLALWLSFSMSEIRGLKFSDIHGDVITINRVLVDVGTVPTVKDTAKTSARIRRHRLPPYLLDLISQTDHSQEFIVPLNHDQIYGRFRLLMDRAGLDITFHDLRHLNASVMLALGVPDKYAMERGGWSTPATMRRVYQHTFSRTRTLYDDAVDDFFGSLVYPLCNEKCNTRPKPVENSTFFRGSIPLGSTILNEDDDAEKR